jgi:hypothetical protein
VGGEEKMFLAGKIQKIHPLQLCLSPLCREKCRQPTPGAAKVTIRPSELPVLGM